MPKPSPKPSGRSENEPSPFFEAARVSSVGLEMAVATGIGWGVGYYIDLEAGTDPLFMLLGLLLGVSAGFNGLVHTARRAKRQVQRVNTQRMSRRRS